jgi:hypothetical protein
MKGKDSRDELFFRTHNQTFGVSLVAVMQRLQICTTKLYQIHENRCLFIAGSAHAKRTFTQE